MLLEISLSRNSSSVGCLKRVQFHNWFRLYLILYQLQNNFRRGNPQCEPAQLLTESDTEYEYEKQHKVNAMR